MCKFVSEKFAKKYYEIGLRYQEHDQKIAIRMAINDGYDIECWEASAAFNAGRKGLPFEINTYKRFGAINVGPDGYAVPSRNHADNIYELGVSVADEDWKKSLRGQISIIEYGNTPIIEFTGLHVGYGSDGEKVVLPVENQIKK